jgi:ABC-type polysaccharide/polyol phosphate export permease
MTTLADYRGSKELFVNLTLRELRSKYKRSFLGWTWSLVNPLASMLVYTVVFEFFLKIKVLPGSPSGLHVYALYLLAALLPWNFFQNCVFGCIGSLVGNANLIKKTYFPRELLPAAAIGSNLVSHLIEMGLLVVALVAFGNWRAIEFLPVTIFLMMVMTVFALGAGMLFSVLNVYFRDIEHFMGIFFLLWLYGTPIIYPITYVHGHLVTILKLNPMTDAALSLRASLYDGKMPGLIELGYFTVFAAFALAVGAYVFNRFEGNLAEEL